MRCPAKDRAGVQCTRPPHDDHRHWNELAGVEWYTRRQNVSPTEGLIALDELHGWRGQGELAIGDAAEVFEAHASPTRRRR